MASLPFFHRNWPRVNDNYFVKCATGSKDCVCVPGQSSFNPSPVTSSKSETVNLLVNSCVANVYSVTGFPQKKVINPTYCHNYTEIKCERCFLCRSLELCKSCHKCPNCCYKSTCRGTAISVLGEVGSSGFESKSSNSTQRGLHPPLLVQTQFNQITNCHKQLRQPTKTVPPFGGTVSAGEQKCCRTSSKPKLDQNRFSTS